MCIVGRLSTEALQCTGVHANAASKAYVIFRVIVFAICGDGLFSLVPGPSSLLPVGLLSTSNGTQVTFGINLNNYLTLPSSFEQLTWGGVLKIIVLTCISAIAYQ